jgi:hypothetical protein
MPEPPALEALVPAPPVPLLVVAAPPELLALEALALAPPVPLLVVAAPLERLALEAPAPPAVPLLVVAATPVLNEALEALALTPPAPVEPVVMGSTLTRPQPAARDERVSQAIVFFMLAGGRHASPRLTALSEIDAHPRREQAERPSPASRRH